MIYDWDLDIPAGGGEVVHFETLAEVSSGDWEWSTEAIVRRKVDGALFYLVDSGCSCSYFGESLTIADLEPLQSIDEGLRKAGDRSAMQRSLDIREGVYT